MFCSGPSNARARSLLSFSYTLQFSAGDRLAQYEILGPLGAGGMGEVYRARDLKLDRAIALKILPAELAANTEALRRFEQEARAASALNHPNIVTIYDIGRSDHLAWIAMELVDGEDLRTLTSREPLTLKNALRISTKIADGLAAAHEKGIVHRDLKPDNIMVTADGFVKILDFGLAKQMRVLTSDDTTVPHTSPGTVFGTVGYMSPEQAMGKEMDYRADQFSFGVLLFEMLTRIRPFDMETKPETMAAIIRAEIEPPSAHNEEIPHDLDRVVARCLAKNPRERYGSTRDLARDLREVRDGLATSSTKIARAVLSPRANSAAAVAASRLPLWPIVFAVLAAMILGGGMFMWTRRDRAAAGLRVTSLAVVPFRDLTSTPEGRILADGISELIAARLAEVRELKVSSPFEGARVADTDDAVTIGRKRAAQGVVRGTVQRGGDAVRVTYALIDATSGKTLVSNTVTRPATELFALEDAVAEDLVRALGRHTTRRHEPVTAALGPDDQRKYVEAVGLLQQVRDGKSVDRAIATLEGLLRNSRESGQVNSLLARALLYKATLTRRRAFIEQATIYANRGVALSANDPETHITLGQLLNASGHPTEAMTAFNKALALRPEDPDAIRGLGDAYQRQGRGADAEKMYRKTIGLRPDSPASHSALGAFFYREGRFEEAVVHFRRSTALAPELPINYANLGAALHALRRYDEALTAYRKSLSLEPTAAGWSNLGALQFFLGHYAEAQQAFQNAVALAPGDVVMWSNLGDACHATRALCTKEAWTRAIAAARQSLAAKPDDAVTRALLASSLAKSGQQDAARREIDQALRLDPTSADVLYQATVVHTLRGAEDNALLWLERAVAAGYPAADAQRDPILEPLRRLPSFSNAVKSDA
jgi:serine/threonine-protein kinase